jgi:hypothetical protein
MRSKIGWGKKEKPPAKGFTCGQGIPKPVTRVNLHQTTLPHKFRWYDFLKP